MRYYIVLFVMGLFATIYPSEDPSQLLSIGTRQLKEKNFQGVKNTIELLRKVAGNQSKTAGVRSMAQQSAEGFEKALANAEKASSIPSAPVTQPQHPQIVPISPVSTPVQSPAAIIPSPKEAPQATPSKSPAELEQKQSSSLVTNEQRECLCEKNKDSDKHFVFYLSLKNNTVPENIKNDDPLATSAPLIGQYRSGNYNFSMPLIFIENNKSALRDIPDSIKNILGNLNIVNATEAIDFFTVVWGSLDQPSSEKTYNLVFHPIVREWVKHEPKINLSNFEREIKMGIFDPDGVKAKSIASNAVDERTVSIHPVESQTAFSPNNAQIEVEADKKIVSFWSMVLSPDLSKIVIIYNVMIPKEDVRKKIEEVAQNSNNLYQLAERFSGLELDANEKEILNRIITISNCVKKTSHLMPNEEELKKLGLCPIFVDLHSEPLYHIIYNGQIQPRFSKTKEPPCTAKYKTFRGAEREVIQIRTVNQSESIDNIKPFSMQCPTLSIRNALLMNSYAKVGVKQDLLDLYNKEKAFKFLQAFECPSKLDKAKMNIIVNDLVILFDLDKKRFSILENPYYLDPYFDVEFLTTEEQEEIKSMKEILREGLLQQDFYYSFVMGNLDERLTHETGEHWYTFTLIKSNETIQYILSDTITMYHLDPRSYEWKRLTDLIGFIEGLVDNFSSLPTSSQSSSSSNVLKKE